MRAFLLTLMLLGCSLNAAHGQRVAPYSTISVFGGFQHDMDIGALAPSWRVESVGEASVATPFYAGQLEAGATIHRYGALADVPPFDAVLAYVGWDVGIRYPRGVRLAVGPRVGMHFMDFDVDAVQGVRSESEVAVGGHVRLTVHPVPYIGLYAAATYMQTYTYIRMTQFYYSTGVVLTVPSPRWLIRVLE